MSEIFTPRLSARPLALKLAALFGLLGTLWILASDRVVSLIAPDAEGITHFQTIKGIFYVSTTTWLVYGLIRLAQGHYAGHLAGSERLRRVQAVQAGVAQAIVRTRDVPAMLAQACAAIAGEGGYAQVWVARVGADGTGLEATAAPGDEALLVAITVAAQARGQSGRCVPLAELVVSGAEPAPPWLAAARARGYAFGLVLPITPFGEPEAVLGVLGPQAEGFDEAGLQLLGGAARDLGFALAYAAQERERNLALAALRERVHLQDYLEKVACSMPGVLYSFRLSPEGRTSIPFATSNLFDLHGVLPEEVCHDLGPAEARVFPEDLPRVIACTEHSARTLTPWHCEFRIRHPERGEVWVEGRSRPERQADGGVLWHGFLCDVTERKRAEARARESEARWQFALEGAGQGVWDWDVPAGKVFFSRRWKEMLGFDEAEVGDGLEEWSSRVHPDDLPAMLADVQRHLRGECEGYQSEHRVRRKDGSYCWVLDRGRVIEWCGDGRPRRMIGTHTDITALREARAALEAQQRVLECTVAERTAALRQQTRYLRALIDNFPFQVWLKDTAGRHLAANLAYARTCGRSVAEVEGRQDAELWPAEVAAQIAAADGAVMDSRSQRVREDLVAQGERPGWVETYVAPVADDDGTLLGTVGYARDISARKAAEAAREGALCEAERLARVRSAFLANMSHEIRTPLNAVLGLAQAGMRDSAEVPARRSFGRILDAGQHLLGVIDDVLDFSKIEAGKLELESELFPLAQAVDRAVDMVAARAYAKGLAFRVTEAPGLPARLRGDLLRLSQVLVNLLSNAVKFTRAGGRVELSVALAGGRLELRVQDTGIGMSAEQQSRLFRPFEQADGSTTRRYGGTGLGLSITRHLVEAMGGEIRARSQAGEGTTFTVHLPVADAEPPCPAPRPARVAVVNLPAMEAAELEAACQDWGAVCEVRQAGAAWPQEADLVVLAADAGMSLPRGPGAAGQRIVRVATPGADNAAPSGLAGVETVDRPLRPRQLLAPTVAGPAVAGHGARLAGVRVLAAEDNEVNRLVLEELLAGEGAELTCVADGCLARARVAEQGGQGWDVLVTDIQMPEMDGYELARRVRGLAPALPIIGLTAHAMREERARCLAAGMVEHVVKPVVLDSLVAAIRRHLPGAGAPAPAPAVARVAVAEGGNRVDWVALAARFKGRQAVVSRLAGTAHRSLQPAPEQLRAAARAGDVEALASLAHSLRGSCGNLLLQDLYALASRTEAAARTGEVEAFTCALELADGVAEVLPELAARAAQAGTAIIV